MILLIDNYDSFTYNLYQYIAELGQDILVRRNDAITLAEIEALGPEAIVISPGPGRPEEAGICIPLIRHFYESVPILGVCLGHQAIAAAFGAEIIAAKRICHGKTSPITHNGKGIFEYQPQPLEVMRYHSLVVDRETVPIEFEVMANDMNDGEIMAIRHLSLPVYGVQFHPESIGTKTGKKLLHEFIIQAGRGRKHEIVSGKTI
ncbi:aminodeoxychorismate/anthranilate synthase component II [Peribacillus cavernae]|uniref:Aminodeoxychorismate/anthranilate synthase component II n=1 Tax=Peribacillus cavernae TaxID=1674310 RepID=A0A3S0VE92_9BACI|nr:aminodeoxychorismate/anthranilate synthase component II [Peribacillus cavernae]MDQ0217230.1 anthranilate synthase/aminodeoxychorismate synthase-like glutamine amidotransferase [Peribacillus cavernae]RUQ30299.1 aminodeoxychorismate/anthranilate synthase component II [Peribacillus cavernae]